MIRLENRAENVTQVLNAAQAGDLTVSHQAFAVIYQELRTLATGRMAVEALGHTLQPTALVHEAWLRLSGSNAGWENRAHFFGAAGEAMRRILVDYARRRNSQKRGSGVVPEELDQAAFQLMAPVDEFLAVDEALDRFALEDPAAAELVKLRYFVGLSMEETASTLGISVRSAERIWTFARVWLKRAIREQDGV